MQSYPRGLEIFGHRFVTVVSRVIAKEMNPVFCRIGTFKFSKTTHCRLRIEHFIFLNKDFVVDLIDSARKIKPGSPTLLAGISFLSPFLIHPIQCLVKTGVVTKLESRRSIDSRQCKFSQISHDSQIGRVLWLRNRFSSSLFAGSKSY